MVTFLEKMFSRILMTSSVILNLFFQKIDDEDDDDEEEEETETTADGNPLPEGERKKKKKKTTVAFEVDQVRKSPYKQKYF